MRRNAKKRPAAKPPPLALGWLLTVTGINSLNALGMAQNRGAEIKYVSRGFHTCNALIAKSDFLLAIAYGEKNVVKDVVAEHIVRRYLERVRKENIFDKSYFYNLTDGKIYVGCNVPPLIN
jgi:hypothetical protein